ncbi:hypothetical protein [Pacificoceanicola onchidii]|uniref:hypothetical protein n=1 Tax=Pacificoceanicola onchidii TaxID=2562685 RepID=UPI0010A31F02|nr:hypothetical protein [Pacificoceanicola onchidii]
MFLRPLAAVTLAALPTLAAADLTGQYTVAGRNADGSTYTGTLALSQDGMTVAADWLVGGTAYSGYGPLEGRVLTINWAPGQPPVIYVTMSDGTLHGTWADGLALEKATPK